MQYVYTFMSVVYFAAVLAIALLDYRPDTFTLAMAGLAVAGLFAIDAITYDKGAE